MAREIEWRSLYAGGYRGWSAVHICTQNTMHHFGTVAVRETPDGAWWVTVGLDNSARPHAGPYDSVEAARTAAEMLMRMNLLIKE